MNTNTTNQRCPTCGGPIHPDGINTARELSAWLITVQRRRYRARIVVRVASYAEALRYPKRVGKVAPWHPPMSLHDTRPELSDKQRAAAAERGRLLRARRTLERKIKKQEEQDQIARWLEEGATSPITLEPLPAIGHPEFYGAIRVNGHVHYLNRRDWWPRGNG